MSWGEQEAEGTLPGYRVGLGRAPLACCERCGCGRPAMPPQLLVDSMRPRNGPPPFPVTSWTPLAMSHCVGHGSVAFGRSGQASAEAGLNFHLCGGSRLQPWGGNMVIMHALAAY